jgi:hypothetical protein
MHRHVLNLPQLRRYVIQGIRQHFLHVKGRGDGGSVRLVLYLSAEVGSKGGDSKNHILCHHLPVICNGGLGAVVVVHT